MDDSYQRIAAYLNVHPDEVNFGPSTTQNVYVLAQAFFANWSAGDEIVVTNQDHEANGGAWRRLAARGITVREWQVDPVTGLLNIDDLDKLLSGKTRLVVFPHCSNIVAHVNPVAEICALAHSAGAKALVDGVSYAAHGFPDIPALGADVYLFSLYKTYGPHQGLMVVRAATLAELENQSHYFNASYAHKKIVPAGPDHAQIAAAGGIAEYFDLIHAHHFPRRTVDAAQRGRDIHGLFRSHEQVLLQTLLDYLATRDDVRILGPDNAAIRAPTVAVQLQGDPEQTAIKLVEHKVMCWSGSFYSPRLLQALGLDPERGVLRLSLAHYTSMQDIEQLIAALELCL